MMPLLPSVYIIAGRGACIKTPGNKAFLVPHFPTSV